MNEQPTTVQPLEHAPREVAMPGILRRSSETDAAHILLAALGAGFLAQLLFVGQRGGINLVVWVSVVLAVALATRPRGAAIDPYDVWLPGAAVVFAAFVALRDDSLLRMFNSLAAAWLSLLSVVAMGGYALTRHSATAVVGVAATAAVVAGFGMPFLGHGARPLLRPLGRRGPLVQAVLRGLLIGVPLLLVFLGLFAAADGVFGAQLAALARTDFLDRDATLRLIVAALAAWVFAGAMAAAWLARRDEPVAQQAGWHLGPLEALIVLALLDVAFACFVAVQAAYLFGGLDTLALSGLTYAEYARRGFFELIAVALLVGLVLLGVGRFVGRRSRPVKAGAILLAVLTGLVLVSATYRLALYQGAYGWTELRFHALAAICWLAISLAAAVVATATDRHRLLPVAVVLAGLLVAVGVNVVGPTGFVTERNLERAINPGLVAPGGRTGLDTEYLYYLGADAVPPMIAARDRLPAADSRVIDRILRATATQLRAADAESGWPSFNLSRHTALQALSEAGY